MAVRTGLLGVSRSAEDAMVAPVERTSDVTIEAVASRTAERAERAAETWRIPRWFSSYERLLRSAAIDGVSISTPAALHRPWVIAALRHGKHVLCNKPLAADHDDAIAIADAGRERE
jgi:predicted dehydrogenase